MNWIPIGLAAVILLSGCSTPKWWPWSAQSVVAKAERAEEKRDEVRDQLVKNAQKSAHEVRQALFEAPTSRPVDVAKESADATVSALDQAAGPLTAHEIAAIRKQIALLLSENADLRRKGEQMRDNAREQLDEISSRLAVVQAKLDKANAELPAALLREAELADRYRFLRNITIGISAIGVLGWMAMIYLKVMYGGVYSAIGQGLTHLRSQNPDAGAVVTHVFDTYLNRKEQSKIKAKT